MKLYPMQEIDQFPPPPPQIYINYTLINQDEFSYFMIAEAA